MGETIRVGVVGYGYASKIFHAPLIATTPGMELTAVSSSSAEKVHADWPDVAVVDAPQALFGRPDIDLIVIPTPNETHFPLARQALQAGKHVVVDKPFTVTLSQAHELNQAAEHVGKLLSVFHNRRWDSDFLTLKQLLKNGALGDVVYMESHFDRYRPQVRQRWREDGNVVGSGIWYDLGPHLLDQALQLFGLPVAIQVDLAQLRPGGNATDYFHATLIYPQRRVVLHASMLAAAESARYIVHGTQGSFVKYGLDPQEDRLKAGERPQADWGHDRRDGILTQYRDGVPREQAVPGVPGNYSAYYGAVRDALNGRGENPVPASQAIQVMELIELGLLSHQERRVIALKNG